MAHRLERLSGWIRKHRTAILIVGAVATVLSVLLIYRHIHPPPSPANIQVLVVQPRPFTATVSLVGVIKAGEPVDIVAPFDGAVAQVGFTYGDPVTAGQTLVRMDDFEIAQHVREGRTAFLKAQEAASEIDSWSSSPDVSRARRANQSAELDLADTRRKLAETKGLLDRGLVPRSEYDALTQQQRTQQISAAAAQEDLARALKRGQGPNREVAALDLQSTRARVGDLESQKQRTLVRAPVDGVMVRPPASGTGDSEVHVGQRLSRGQLIGSIARRDALVVELALNEADAGRVRVGQAATVSGGGLGALQLAGTVISVAGEARPAMSGAGSSTVAARVRLDGVPAAAQSAVRIGMTANVSIKVHDVRSALVVPPQAVIGAPPAGQVLVRDPRTGADQPRAVTIGYAGEAGVEITSGLKPGDTIVWKSN